MTQISHSQDIQDCHKEEMSAVFVTKDPSDTYKLRH